MRLHIDTDLGGDPDDACALVMVLGWPDVEVTGITTTADPDGQRAGCVHHLLELLARTDIPVAAGAGSSLTTGAAMGAVPDLPRYWGIDVPRRPSTVGAATDLLAGSIEAGATVVAIGPATNLALLEKARPGALRGARVVLMGGWVGTMPAGFPPWGPSRDWNVQCDTAAVRTIAAIADLTLVTMPATISACLRGQDLPRLEAAGPVGRLLARQSTAHRDDYDLPALATHYDRLPEDLVNFHWDPVACAVALGWPGADLRRLRLRPVLDKGVLRFEGGERGRPIQVLTRVEAERFTETWLTAVEAAIAPGYDRRASTTGQEDTP